MGEKVAVFAGRPGEVGRSTWRGAARLLALMAVLAVLLASLMALPARGLADEGTAPAVGSASCAPASGASARAVPVRVEACGVSFELPAGTEALKTGVAEKPTSSGAAVDVAPAGTLTWWVPCADEPVLDDGAPASGGFTCAVAQRAWSGDEVDLQAYADAAIARAAEASEGGARVAEGGFGESPAGVRYYLAGMVDRTSMTLLAAVPLAGAGGAAADPAGASNVAADPATFSAAVFVLHGTPDDATVRAMAGLLASLAPATGAGPDASAVFDRAQGLAYYSVDRLAGLSSNVVVDLLERGAGLSYVDSGSLQGWAGPDAGPLGADGCVVALVEYADADADGPFATRAAACAGERLSGVQVEWRGAAIPWDEVSDAADALMAACGLGGALDDGYTSPWDDEGAYAWARVGSCEVGGEPGYWLVLVDATRGADDCTVTLSADLLHGSPATSGFATYDEVVDALLGW